MCDPKRSLLEAGLEAQLRAHDDATLEYHCQMWEQGHGETVSRWTMSRIIKHLGWTRKKSLGATERSEEERTFGKSKQTNFREHT